jgi:hypothetical protein
MVLAGGTMLLQAQKKAETKHSAPPAHEHTAAPKKEEHTAPVREHANPGVEHPQGNSKGRTFGNHPAQTPHAPNSVVRPAPINPASAHGNGLVNGPAGHTVTTPRGDVIHRSPNGQVREVHMSSGAVVYHPPNGPRRVEVVRPGGQVVVAGAPGHGYVQRSIAVHNTTIIKRTYLNNGVPMARFYQPRMYNGVTLFVYRPVRYYRPAFYLYAYNPWRRPVVYVWGWGRSPWYGYYSGYFSPYPEYRSPSLWLTDYLIAATLESAYQERMAANSMPMNNYAGGQPMTPETKQAIAEEVRRQIDVQRMEQNQMGSGGGSVTTIFSDNAQHVFVANSSYMYNSNDRGAGDECDLGGRRGAFQPRTRLPQGQHGVRAVAGFTGDAQRNDGDGRSRPRRDAGETGTRRNPGSAAGERRDDRFSVCRGSTTGPECGRRTGRRDPGNGSSGTAGDRSSGAGFHQIDF